jgi:glutathione S-transferase
MRSMITVHHLNDSRSQRILWLLEELGLDYEVRHYQRDATTRLAPPELLAVHPLGKSPTLEMAGRVYIESGAIVDALLRRHPSPLRPAEGSAAFDDYQQWLHYAEGSAMLPLMLKLYTGRLGDAAAPLKPRIDSELALHLGFVEQALQGRDWLLGEAGFSGADVQMSFVGEAIGKQRAKFPAIDAWVRRFQQRPAYRRALERGGPYGLAG